ncbi:hypothetical protein CLHUN_32580 [Ruminiclostridium hungatei]|uniref:DUF3885 domain-containing protein n=1 Tax=Ruminiclostridium hungatei TaxID=48256 RepID=A0A1V4SG55_RUMHU|nr:DUF3885 domain-containing protein [Ruminiclostridium hungatei]OPX42774.1 hypothetical protein CLHUN_32580 [Ruminiclostridium hungatei]
MRDKLRVESYLKEHFPNIPLESPLFYKAPIGIRFELGVPYRGLNRREYFTYVCLRASMIFQEVFKPEEDMIVVVKKYRSIEPYICINQGEEVFPKYIKNNKFVDQVDSVEIEKYVEADGELSGISTQQTLFCKANDIDYMGMLKAKARQDFGVLPFISDGVFFINAKKNIIFYMYDDRGLDLVAENKESLLPLYKKFNDWILNYDRERINEVFMNKNS